MYIFIPIEEEKIVFRFSKEGNIETSILEKKNYEKKTGQHYQEGEKIVTGISTLQQFRNMLVVILVISNPVHWSK